MAELPSGTVTFLLTDVEGSTALWEQADEAMRDALARHDVLFDEAVARHSGIHIRPRGEGDSRFAVFVHAPDAVAAALDIQCAFAAEPWPTPRPIKVRIGIHTGQVQLRDGDYYGSAVNRCARLREIGHGGQVLLSEVTARLARGVLPSGAALHDLAEHQLRGFERPERMYQLVHPELPADFPPLVGARPPRHNLPAQTTPLVGRDEDVERVCALLRRDDVRLVTLTGAGGVGKTRVGLGVATRLLDYFGDGVFWVSLAPIGDRTLVLSTIAQALGLRESGGRAIRDTVEGYLGERHLLLVLDNFEQVLPAAPLVAELLAACPRLKVLVTSRAALHLRGEQEIDVPPLAYPDPNRPLPVEAVRRYPAVALFVQRTGEVKADFSITDESARTIAEICRRVDGLPLGIELAAARVRLLTPRALLARMERRLPLLTGGARDLPARQRTLRGTIAWSYDLLDRGEQRLFRRLSVFEGGCTLEGAQAVGAGEGDTPISVLDTLTSLVAQSLVQQREGADGESRFGMLDTIREYGLEQLEASGEAAEIRRRHAGYFVALVERAAPELRGREQVAWLARLDAEQDNLRAVLRWIGEHGELAMGLRLGAAVWRFWQIRGHHTEGRERLTELLELTKGANCPALRAALLIGLGRLLQDQHDYAAARCLVEEGLLIQRRLGDERGVAQSLNYLGWIAIALEDLAAARQLIEEGLDIARRLIDERGLADAFNALGWIAIVEGDHAKAHLFLEESLNIRRRLGDTGGVADVLIHLGWLVQAEGDSTSARGLIAEGLTIGRDLRDKSIIADALEVLVKSALAAKESQRAARLLGAAHGLRGAIGVPLPPGDCAAYEDDLVAVRASLGDQAFAAAWAEGQEMSLEQAVAYGLDEAGGA